MDCRWHLWTRVAAEFPSQRARQRPFGDCGVRHRYARLSPNAPKRVCNARLKPFAELILHPRRPVVHFRSKQVIFAVPVMRSIILSLLLFTNGSLRAADIVALVHESNAREREESKLVTPVGESHLQFPYLNKFQI